MLFSSVKNSVIALALSVLITGTAAPDGAKSSSSNPSYASIVNCTSTSPDCCWVVRSWQLMGKTTSVSSTSATACCSMTGVECGSANKVTMLVWNVTGLKNTIPSDIGRLTSLTHLYLHENKLEGSIPAEIGNLTKLIRFSVRDNQLSGPVPSSIGKLTKLEYLYLFNNKLSGSISWIGKLVRLTHVAIFDNGFSGLIPSEIGNFRNLEQLALRGNPSLFGYLKLSCGVNVYATKTKIILCGCSTSGSPPVIFPPPGTLLSCLATGPATSMPKRSLVFSQIFREYKFTCNNDSNGNPFQDCFNSLGAVCNTDFVQKNGKTICRNSVDAMAYSMNWDWKNVRSSCGQWSYKGVVGSVTSPACIRANNALKANALYYQSEGIKSSVSWEFIESVNTLLWSNNLLK